MLKRTSPFLDRPTYKDLRGGTTASASTVTTYITQFLFHRVDGTLTVAGGTHRYPFANRIKILGFIIAVGTAPTGDDIIVDVNANGSSIFTAAGRPIILAGNNISAEAFPYYPLLEAGGYVTFDVDQIGSSVAGSDLVIAMEWVIETSPWVMEDEEVEIDEGDIHVLGIFEEEDEDLEIDEEDLHFLALARLEAETVQMGEEVLKFVVAI